MDVISLIIWVILLALVFYAAIWVIGWMALPDPAALIVRVLVGLVMLLVILGMVTGHVPMAHVNFWR
jgi:hypothetical protein